MPDSWYFLPCRATPAAENMASDEALLEAAARLGRPVLRFYGWSEPAASFGYSQRYAGVARWTHLRPLVRRPTGGGLVPHDADWTYSLIFPPTHRWYGLKATESYQRVHEWIQAAFRAGGVGTQLSPQPQKRLPGQCFAGAERFDLIWEGRKIAGAAQRRNRQGLLIQGSVQPLGAVAVGRAVWEQAMRECIPWGGAVAWEQFELDAELAVRVGELVRGKYSQPAYNQRR